MITCESCKYCQKIEKKLKGGFFGNDEKIINEFYCYRYPPLADMSLQCNDGLTGIIKSLKIVQVGEMYWCGEYQKVN